MKKHLVLMSLFMAASTNFFGALEGRAFAFGVSGKDGARGSHGADGKQGEDIGVFANGEARQFYLNGSNGSLGGDGSSGSDAYACSYSEGYGNEYGASGGDGGDGGDGGAGGRGGDITVFYTDIAKIKSITLESQGGYGAPGGYGSTPGYGCECYSSSWSRESCHTEQSCSSTRVCEDTGTTHTQDGRTAPARVCHDHRVCRPVTSCSTNYYSCSDGSDGRKGSDGAQGKDGRWGRISLVKNLKKLPKEKSFVSFDVSSFVQGEAGAQESGEKPATALLKKQIWKNKKGAKNLFAEGSLIQDSYREYVRLAERKLRLVWEASSPVEKFKGNKFFVEFDGEKFEIKTEGDDFLKYDVQEKAGETLVTVSEAFKKADIEKLKVQGTKGYGDNLVISIKDEAGLSSIVKSEIKLEFVHKSWFSWFVVYNETVPANALSFSDGEIKIHVGKLGIMYKAIKRRKKVRFTVYIKRSFGNNSTSVKEFYGPVKLY